MVDEPELQSAITPTPMPTTLSLVPAASSPVKFPAAASDVDFNIIPGTGTGTSTGTTSLAVTGSTGKIVNGAVVSGAGVPAGVWIVSGPPGGGNGTYTTNIATTLAAVALTFAPDLPIDPDGDPDPPIVVKPATAIPGEPLIKTNAGHDYTLVLPTFAWMPLKHDATNIFNKSQVPPFIGATYPFHPTPPPALTMTRTPPFPAYPS